MLEFLLVNKDDDDDYSDLIISPNHFEKGENSKGMVILRDDENAALINQMLHDVIREAYRTQPNWT